MKFCAKCGKDNWDTSGIYCLNCGYQDESRLNFSEGVMKKTNDIQYPDVGEICICGKCGRKILVERLVNGTNHTIQMFVCCWNCISEKDKKDAMKRYKI